MLFANTVGRPTSIFKFTKTNAPLKAQLEPEYWEGEISFFEVVGEVPTI
jgi:hypothetical protein